MSTPESFSHTPLSNAEGQIRLLKLSALGNGDDDAEHIQCELVTCDIDTKPRYIAVSYTWGDPARTRAVSINGKTLTVRYNCWYVLWQACINSVSDLLWIDAICINQLDDDEKSFQVRMMGQIYRNAERVNVCLGPHNDNSQLLIDATKQHAVIVETELQSFWKSGDLSSALQPFQRQGRVELGLAETAKGLTMSMFTQSVRSVLLEEMSTRERFSTLARKNLEALTEARYCLTERSYFTRLWICQEILLGRKVMLIIGDSSVAFEDFIDFESDLVGYCLRQKSGPHAGVEFDASQEFLSIVNIRNSWSATGMGLLELTDVFSRFQCFDNRDRIFGMLGMVDWQGYSPMVPNYRKTAFEVGIDALSYMCPLPEETSAERDNTAWPIVSAIQIASALSLDAEESEVKKRLQLRRSQCVGQQTVKEEYDMPSETHPHIEVVADFYCPLFTLEDSNDYKLFACLIDRGHQPDGTFSKYILDSKTDSVACSSLVYSKASPGARVSSDARAGDVLISFRTNGTEIGLLVRREREDTHKYIIVGQAVLHEATEPCPGDGDCSCGFGDMPHQLPGMKIKVYFDPEDLLLFACQDLYKTIGEDPDNGANLRRFETIQTGEMIQVADLEDLRFQTSVTRPDNPMSSYAELVQIFEKSPESEEDRDMAEKLRELQLHLNSRKTEAND